jgi:hypothetical protein
MDKPQREITYIGMAVGSGRTWCALDALGNPIPGAFTSLKAAASAVNTSFAGSCVADTSGRQDNG